MVESRLHWKYKNQEASLLDISSSFNTCMSAVLSAVPSTFRTCILFFLIQQQKQYILDKYTDNVSTIVIRSIYTEVLKVEVHGDTAVGGASSSSLYYFGEVARRVSLYQPFHQPSEHVYCVSSIGDKSSISQANIPIISARCPQKHIYRGSERRVTWRY